MTDKPKDNPEDRAQAQAGQAEQADVPLAADDHAGGDAHADQQPTAAPEDVLALVQKERDQLEERLLRVSADYQNYVRRSNQNVAAAREQAVMDVAKALLTVLDHFDRALEIDASKTSAADLLKGVGMVRDELLRTLERFGIQRLEARQGEVFDPNRHEALLRQAVEGIDANHVAQQLQPGYLLGERTLRPAKVAVTE